VLSEERRSDLCQQPRYRPFGKGVTPIKPQLVFSQRSTLNTKAQDSLNNSQCIHDRVVSGTQFVHCSRGHYLNPELVNLRPIQSSTLRRCSTIDFYQLLLLKHTPPKHFQPPFAAIQEPGFSLFRRHLVFRVSRSAANLIFLSDVLL
jgi:hypothetical protein